ncbi:MAG: mechanosensitive ion channel family protein [Deltaproteobacteria bacterium]|nr:mechanosensitive ion channel family protein [Deltaproteobacteria bacterium]
MDAIQKELGWLEAGKQWLMNEAPGFAVDLAVFLALLLIGWIIIGMIRRVLRAALVKTGKINEMLIAFTVSVTSKTLWVVVLMVALPRLGINVAPLIAGLGVSGFVLGFAFQESLSNLAAGVMIMVAQPFTVGDYIEGGGSAGKVTELNLLSTELLTPDNKRVTIPNRKIWGETITNYSAEENRRLDLVIGIGYGDDIGKALKVIGELVTASELVLAEPAPVFEVLALADSSVNLAVRPWVKTADYWPAHFALTRAIKEALDANGIEIPFPQRTIHQAAA